MLHVVIMAGGSGTRFWPESRRARPKQFLRLTGERTLLQETSDRCRPLVPPERTWVVTNQRLADETRRQLPDLPAGNVLLEPCARNTGPCVGLAAQHLLQHDPDAVMALLPADHVIETGERFRDALRQAVRLVEDDGERLVLFGVRPSYAATGYGYIERGEMLGAGPAHRVASFREKPDAETAERYLASGRFLWNCGIFVWRAGRILRAIADHRPRMAEVLDRIASAVDTPCYETVLAEEFPQAESVSIDVAVLERDPGSVVLEAPFTWDDVGSWQAMARLHGADAHGNTVIGLHQGVRTQGCVIRSTSDHLVATIGIEDCVIVHTPDATLVARKDDETAIRRLIELLQEQGHEQFL